jgi:hypothetical protein
MAHDSFAALPAKFRENSISDRERVVPYELALEAVDLLEAKGILILGWEGWLAYQDGGRGHSGRHQGTVSLDQLSVAESASLVRRTIANAYKAWLKEPEYPGAQLYFCITPSDDPGTHTEPRNEAPRAAP